MDSFNAFWQTCGEDHLVAQQVVALLESELHQHIVDIELAIKHNDNHQLEEVFHKLKGNLNHLGFSKRAKAFSQLEQMSQRGLTTALINKYHKEKTFIANLPKILAKEVSNTRQS